MQESGSVIRTRQGLIPMASASALEATCSDGRPQVVVAMLTPFRADGRVDLEPFRQHVAFLVTSGVDGVMPCGTTGEGPLLDEDEASELIAAAVEASAGSAKVIAHIGRASTRGTIRLARRAIDSGADCLAAVVPYYYEVDNEQVLRHYRTLLDVAGETRVLAYNIPSRTGNDLDLNVLAKLADDGLAGIKDSTKSFARHREYLRFARGRSFAVYMGSDSMVFDAFREGSTGSVSALANVRPDLLLAMKAAISDGHEDVACGIQSEISKLRDQLSGDRPLAGLKRGTSVSLAARGVAYPTRLRRPL